MNEDYIHVPKAGNDQNSTFEIQDAIDSYPVLAGFPKVEATPSADKKISVLLQIGADYLRGINRNKDEARGISMLLALADLTRDPDIYFMVGLVYLENEADPEYFKKAYNWFTKAAELGNNDAQYYVGRRLLLVGFGDKQDKQNGIKWLMLSSAQHNADAQYLLGQAYRSGLGVAKDPEKMVAQFQQAAHNGSTKAKLQLGMFYEDTALNSDDARTIKKSHRKAHKWFKDAANDGSIEAQFKLGFNYSNNIGVAINGEEAIKWYTMAAEQGDKKSQSNIAYIYELGIGVPVNKKKSFKWASMAAHGGPPKAIHNLAWNYANGFGVRKNYKKAARLYEEAARLGIDRAQHNLGLLYSDGSLPHDYGKAVRWLTMAAEQKFQVSS